MSETEIQSPPKAVLHFSCGGCGHELEAPESCAGVEGPCPVCGAPVRAPLPESFDITSPLMWDFAPPEKTPPLDSTGKFEVQPGRTLLPPPRNHPLPTREEEEAMVEASYKVKMRWLQIFDAALFLFFLGTLAVGGAALVFTEKQSSVPVTPPELSDQVVQRMQQLDQRRAAAIASSNQTLKNLLAAQNRSAAESSLMPGIAESPELTFPLFPQAPPTGFEFIQARRIPATERFLMTFEMAANPPLVLLVEETGQGTRVHGQALTQQLGGRFGKFLASQGQGEATFYVLLRPARPPMTEELLQSRPDLQKYSMVSVEPAFPADGANGCLVAMTEGSEAAKIFARRSHDTSLRPAVVQLAWRQHRESGGFIELVGFQPNAWSRY